MAIPKTYRPRNAKTWSWATGIGKDLRHHILHLEGDCLYSRTQLSAGECERLCKALKTSPPMTALDPPDILPLSRVVQLRMVRGIGLKIDHGDPHPFLFASNEARDAFKAIREALPTKYTAGREKATLWEATQGMVYLAVLAAILGGVATIGVFSAESLSDQAKWLAPIITGGVIAVCLAISVYQALNPPLVEVVTVNNPDPEGTSRSLDSFANR